MSQSAGSIRAVLTRLRAICCAIANWLCRYLPCQRCKQPAPEAIVQAAPEAATPAIPEIVPDQPPPHGGTEEPAPETVTKEMAQEFIRATAWWLTHSSGRPVRAPGHADRIRRSVHGWAVNFGANAFLAETAIKRCRVILYQYRAQALSGQPVSRAEVREHLKKAISGSVANSNGVEYGGYYPITDDCLIFGAQAIDVDDGANFMIRATGLRWLFANEAR